MPAIERGPKLPEAVRMIYPLPASYKARLERISLREAKSVAWLTAQSMMELIDRLDPIDPASTPEKPAKKKSGKNSQATA